MLSNRRKVVDITKIICPAIVKEPSFALDTEGHYSNDKTTIIINDEKKLLDYLNGPSVELLMRKMFPSKQNGYYEFKPTYLESIPVPIDL